MTLIYHIMESNTYPTTTSIIILLERMGVKDHGSMVMGLGKEAGGIVPGIIMDWSMESQIFTNPSPIFTGLTNTGMTR